MLTPSRVLPASRKRKKNISFTPLRGVAEPDKIAACLYTRRDVKANLHGPLLMIHPSRMLSTKGFLFQAGIGIIHGSNRGNPSIGIFRSSLFEIIKILNPNGRKTSRLDHLKNSCIIRAIYLG